MKTKTVTLIKTGKVYALCHEYFVDGAVQADRKARIQAGDPALKYCTWESEENWNRTIVVVRPINPKNGKPWQKQLFYFKEEVKFND